MLKYVPFRKKKSTSERIMEQITDAANKVTDQATSTAAVVKQHATDSAATIKHQATDTASNLKQQASGTASTLKQQASGTASTLKLQASGTASTLKQQASGTASTLKQQASGTASSLSAHASDTAANLKQQASGTANSLAAQASERMPKTSVNSDQMTKDVKALAATATAAAVDLLENARVRSQIAVNAAPSREQIGLATTAVAGRAKSANTALIDQAQRLLEIAKQAENPINTSVAVAKDKSKVAAKSTADAGKNGVAIAIWSTALVAIILYVLMGKERRERTINRAKAAAAEVQDLVHDYRGYDADIESGTV